eukprot:7888203-Pyramimonas_sp.AAC.1
MTTTPVRVHRIDQCDHPFWAQHHLFPDDRVNRTPLRSVLRSSTTSPSSTPAPMTLAQKLSKQYALVVMKNQLNNAEEDDLNDESAPSSGQQTMPTERIKSLQLL